MGSRKLLLLASMILGAVPGWRSAQSPTYGVGRAPTRGRSPGVGHLRSVPTGKELPPGHGTAKEGAPLYIRRDAPAATAGPARAARRRR